MYWYSDFQNAEMGRIFPHHVIIPGVSVSLFVAQLVSLPSHGELRMTNIRQSKAKLLNACFLTNTLKSRGHHKTSSVNCSIMMHPLAKRQIYPTSPVSSPISPPNQLFQTFCVMSISQLLRRHLYVQKIHIRWRWSREEAYSSLIGLSSAVLLL